LKYDMDAVGKVYIYGDGASWIKSGLDIFAGAIYSVDTFHYKKYMRRLFSGETGSGFALKAHAAVSSNDKAVFESVAQMMRVAVLNTMPDGSDQKKKDERITKDIGYILNNWDGIQNSKLPGVIGSCTEALVSHVLSERLSRSPMGWSKKGLSKMAMIRIYSKNGEKILPIDTLAWKHSDRKLGAICNIDKYENIVKLQHDEVFKDCKSWRWFEKDNKISGKTSGTKVVLDSLSKLKYVS